MPESIVVGIANVDRKRDFTYPSTIPIDRTEFPTSGGAAEFIAFIAQELQPYIQKTIVLRISLPSLDSRSEAYWSPRYYLISQSSLTTT